MIGGSSIDANNFLEADGAGSAITFGNGITALHGSTGFDSFFLRVTGGGAINATSVTSIPDGAVNLRADGPSSLIDLSHLTSYTPTDFNGSRNLEAHGGTIKVPLLTTLQNVNLIEDGATSQIDTAQLTNVNLDSIAAQNGATVNLPGVTSIQSGDYNLNYEADAGTLNFPNLTVIHGSTGFDSIFFRATGGGEVNLSAVTSIPDGAVNLRTDNPGSLIDLSHLTAFTPTDINGARNIEAHGGIIKVPLLTNLQNVTLIEDGSTSQIDTTQLTNINLVSVFAQNGATINLPGVTALQTGDYNLNIEADGGTLNLPNLTVIHGSAGFDSIFFRGTGGGSLNLSAVTSITDGAVNFRTDNTGSLIDLSHLTALTPTNFNGTRNVEAHGGIIKVPLLTNLQNVTLVEDGATSQIDTTQLTNINLVSVFAQNGATINLPGVTALQTGDYNLNIEADGGTLNLPNLTVVHGSTGFDSIFFRATGGGTLNLSAVTSITDGAVNFRTDNTGSLIDLSHLTALTPTNFNGSRNVEAHGGIIKVPLLTNLQNVTLVEDGSTSQIDTAQLTNINLVNVFAQNGAMINLPGVTALQTGDYNLNIEADGGTLNLPNLMAIHGSTGFDSIFFRATGGGEVNLSAVVAITDGAVTFRTDNTGSLIDLSHLTTLTPTDFNGTRNLEAHGGIIKFPLLTNLQNVTLLEDGATSQIDTAQLTNINLVNVFAQNGAIVNLSGVTSIQSGDYNLTYEADGGTLNLPNLTVIHGSTGFDTIAFRATAGGLVNLSAVTSIPDGAVNLRTDNTGSTIDLSHLTAFTPNDFNGSRNLEAHGGIIKVPLLTTLQNVTLVEEGSTAQIDTAQLTNINLVNVFAENGATVNLPGVTSLQSGDTNLTIEAGAGTLNLPNLTVIHGSTGFDTIAFRATGGGQLNLSAVASIPDGAVNIRTDNAGSVIDLSHLTAFTASNFNGSRNLEAHGGAIKTPLLSNLQNVTLIDDGVGAQIDTALISNIDSDNVYAQNGAIVILSGVTTITGKNATATPHLEADNSGAQLNLPNLNTIHGGTTFRVFLGAFGGAGLSAPLLASVPDGGVLIRSDGAGSVVDVSHLSQVTNTIGTDASELDATSGGMLKLNATGTIALTNTDVNLLGTIVVGTLQVGAGSRLFGNGLISGNLQNSGGEIHSANGASAVLTVTGNFTQSSGTTFIGLQGPTAGTQYDQFVVGGSVTLAGTLQVSEFNGYTPALGTVFQIFTYGSLSGTFATISDNDAIHNFTPTYGTTSLVLTVS